MAQTDRSFRMQVVPPCRTRSRACQPFLGRVVRTTGRSSRRPMLPAGAILISSRYQCSWANPSTRLHLKSIGINSYMGAEHDGSSISSITSQGLFVLAQDEWTQAEVGSDPKAVGWFISDECDIGLGCTGSNAAENLADQTRKVNRVRAFGDGRFTMANYSNGILDTYWAQGIHGRALESSGRRQRGQVRLHQPLCG